MNNSLLAESVRSLFGRWPLLQGFSVCDADVVLADVSCYPTPSAAQGEELCSDIALVLCELVEERPEAAELLRGRSFARTLH
jgi:hypothetical protein